LCNTDFPLSVKSGDFSAFVCVHYENLTENIPLPFIFVRKTTFVMSENIKMCNSLQTYDLKCVKCASVKGKGKVVLVLN